MIKQLITILLTALSLAGCQEELPKFAQIEAGKENLSFTQVSGTQTVEVKASHAWTAVSSGGWLTVSPDKGGAGTYELTLTQLPIPQRRHERHRWIYRWAIRSVRSKCRRHSGMRWDWTATRPWCPGPQAP